MEAVLTAINSKYIHTALGLRYISEYAKKQGHKISLIEESVNTPILTVLEKIMEKKAIAYGFSVHIWNKQFVFRLIKMLKKLRPTSLIIVGGPEVAFDPQKIFSEINVIDYIVQGEGEVVFSELLTSLQDSRGIPDHVAYKVNGKAHTSSISILDDLSLLPFPYPDLQQIISEKKIIYYECTRGCPFRCSYCLSGITKFVRKRPLNLVLSDLERFIISGVSLVKFVDRTYNFDKNYYLPIMKFLANAKTKATFHFEIKADILGEEVMAFLAHVPRGRFQFEIGIQSTHLPTLKAINRYDDWQKLEANVRKLLSYGNIHIHVDLIAGLPYEGLSTFAKSFNDVYGLHAHMLQLGFLKVLPGTQMRSETEKHDLLYMDEPPYEILATKYMPYENMQKLKHIENILDQTANTGCFNGILKALIKYADVDAFSFYQKLAIWWIDSGYYPQNHNVKGVAAIIYKFIQQNFNEDIASILTEVLRHDVFLSLPGWEPEWLNWNTRAIFAKVSAFWHNEELVREYIPNYSFSSWRQIHKNYPIELFKYHWDTMEEGEYYILLDRSDIKQEVMQLSL